MKALYDLHEELTKYLLTSSPSNNMKMNEATLRKNEKFLSEHPKIAELLNDVRQGINQHSYDIQGAKSTFRTYNPKDNFNEDEFYKILSFCVIAHDYEKNGEPLAHAIKLYTLFKNARNALYALKSYAEQEITPNVKKYTTQYIHDACQFSLPDERPHSWEKFREYLINSNLSDKDILMSLPQADLIEENYKNWELSPEQSVKYPILTSDEFIKKYTIEKNNIKKIKSLLSKESIDRETKSTLRSQLSQAYINFAILCKRHNIDFNDLDKAAVIGAKYHFTQKNFLLHHGITMQNIEVFNSLDRKNAGSLIPEIGIVPIDKYPGVYWRKLNVQDEKDAMIAACLGKLTNCCQSIGDQGGSCAIHGLTKPESGFYVLCYQDESNTDSAEEILCQSWAWRNQNDLVLDSVEYSSKKVQNYLRPFQINESEWSMSQMIFIRRAYLDLGYFLHLNNNELDGIYIGTGGQTPSILGEKVTNSVKQLDDIQYNDSIEQRYIYNKNLPKLWLSKIINSANKEEIMLFITNLQNQLEIEVTSNHQEFFDILNVLIEEEISIDKISEIAHEYNVPFQNEKKLILERLFVSHKKVKIFIHHLIETEYNKRYLLNEKLFSLLTSEPIIDIRYLSIFFKFFNSDVIVRLIFEKIDKSLWTKFIIEDKYNKLRYFSPPLESKALLDIFSKNLSFDELTDFLSYKEDVASILISWCQSNPEFLNKMISLFTPLVIRGAFEKLFNKKHMDHLILSFDLNFYKAYFDLYTYEELTEKFEINFENVKLNKTAIDYLASRMTDKNKKDVLQMSLKEGNNNFYTLLTKYPLIFCEFISLLSNEEQRAYYDKIDITNSTQTTDFDITFFDFDIFITANENTFLNLIMFFIKNNNLSSFIENFQFIRIFTQRCKNLSLDKKLLLGSQIKSENKICKSFNLIIDTLLKEIEIDLKKLREEEKNNYESIVNIKFPQLSNILPINSIFDSRYYPNIFSTLMIVCDPISFIYDLPNKDKILTYTSVADAITEDFSNFLKLTERMNNKQKFELFNFLLCKLPNSYHSKKLHEHLTENKAKIINTYSGLIKDCSDNTLFHLIRYVILYESNFDLKYSDSYAVSCKDFFSNPLISERLSVFPDNYLEQLKKMVNGVRWDTAPRQHPFLETLKLINTNLQKLTNQNPVLTPRYDLLLSRPHSDKEKSNNQQQPSEKANEPKLNNN